MRGRVVGRFFHHSFEQRDAFFLARLGLAFVVEPVANGSREKDARLDVVRFFLHQLAQDGDLCAVVAVLCFRSGARRFNIELACRACVAFQGNGPGERLLAVRIPVIAAHIQRRG